MVKHTGEVVTTTRNKGLDSTIRTGTGVRRCTTRSGILHTLTRFSLIEVCKGPCARSRNTSLNMPLMARILRSGTGPTHDAITRICARMIGSLARTVDSGTLTARARPNCMDI